MEEKEKQTAIKQKITIIAIMAMILAVIGTVMVFSNNLGIQSSNAANDGIKRIGETSGEANEGTEIESSVENYKATIIEETSTADGKKSFTITNKYNGPIISAQKTVEEIEVNEAGEKIKKQYDGYVVENEEVEYTITAINAGETVKTDLLIADTIPTGITFVEGSIKVNGNSTYKEIDLSQKTATDLAAGIRVDVPAKSGETNGETKLSFRATVNPLEGNTLEKTIKNIAVVGEGPTVIDPSPEVDITVKKAKIMSGKSAVVNGTEKTTVEKGDEITYTITVENSGEAPTEVNVKDTVPTNTLYKENSFQIKTEKNGVESTDETTITMDELISEAGIQIEVNPKEKKKIIFTVTVQDTDNDIKIRNVATVGEETPTVEHTYIEPVIDIKKTVTKEDGTEIKEPNYVLEGQKIKYKITVTNEGSKETAAVIKDQIPEGLTFVEGSVVIDDEANEAYGVEDLSTNGITVNVPAKTEITAEGGEKTVTPGQVVLEFAVTVNELGVNDAGEKILTKTIGNIATVTENEKEHNSTEVPVTVNKPDLKVTKTANLGADVKVKAGDKITYTIELNNSKGTAPTTATVSDSAPKGTTFESAKVMNGDTEEKTLTEQQLQNGTEVQLAAGETKTVVFTVVVGNKADATEDQKIKDGEKISNVANVNGEETNPPVEHTYIEPIINIEKTVATEKNLGYVVKNEEVTYTITVKNSGGLAKEVTVTDNISKKLTLKQDSVIVKVNGVEQTESTIDLTNGLSVTETVPEKVGENDGTVEIIFVATVNENASGELTNTAIVDNDKEAPAEDKPIVTFNKTATIDRKTTSSQTEISDGSVTANDEIIYKITVTNSGNETANSITVTDKVPTGTTLKADSITENGTADEDGNITWTITDLAAGQSKEVSFTVTVNYHEKNTTIENTAYVAEEPTDKTTTEYEKPEGKVENTVEKTSDKETITKEDEAITYNIEYTATVKDYVGDAEVTITDQLPFAIDETKSDLSALGEKDKDYTYNAETHTITYTTTVTGINTYKDGAKEIAITKAIKVVYTNMDYSMKNFDNTATGKLTLKYLEDEEPKEFPTKPSTVNTKTDFKTSVEVIKKWNHTNNIYGIPENVVIILKANGVEKTRQTLTRQDNNVTEGTAENEEMWKYTFENLDKYDAEGNEIDYTVSEKE